MLMWRADVHAHYGRLDQAAGVLDDTGAGFWWDAPFRSMRAEMFARIGHPETDAAIQLASDGVGEHRYALGFLLRAQAIRSGDEAPMRQALELFEKIECPYQAARSGWLLGGSERDQARQTLAELGAVPLPD
jgi:hypothetical protein